MGTKEHPKALNISEQIQNLKDNNLIIKDEEAAARILQRVSYYRLIKAYGPFFKDQKKSSRYRDGTTFDHIYRVYEFDNQLRHLLNPYLQDIEITFRCQIANYHSVKYGPLGYLDSSALDDSASYNELRTAIDLCIEKSQDSPIIKHFRNVYSEGKIPLYAAIELFTFGTLAQFYSKMKTEDRTSIADLYEGVDQYYLSSWLISISYVRNLCSHFNRLYNRTLIKKPRLYPRQDQGVDNSRLFGVLCCMRYLCKESGEWRGFVNALSDLLTEYQDCIKPSGIGCQRKDWKEKLLDQEPQFVLGDLLSKIQLE